MESLVHSAELELLRAENKRFRQRAETAEVQAKTYQEKLALLEYELTQLKRLIFGSKSERFELATHPDQLPLFGALDTAEAPVVTEEVTYRRRKRSKKPSRQALPDHLPREVIVIEPKEDTTDLKKIGEEIAESLDYRPAKLVVIRRVRPKYADADNRGVIMAPLPARPIEKGIAEPGLLAHVLVEKYVDHLPIYRQVQRFKREGIKLPRSTLEGWVAASANVLAPLYDRLGEMVLASSYLQADETPIQVQDRQVKGKTHRGQYWVYHAPELRLVLMVYDPTRRHGVVHTFLEGYQGALQSDGYEAYEGFDKVPGVMTFSCWAHARRKFYEARDNDPERAEHALAEIGLLYDIERILREQNAWPEERRQMRRQKAVPILDRLKPYLESELGLPKSPWGKATRYALARWKKLCRYTEDGRIEIDNNLVENTIRPIALGKKNYLFAGSHAAAQRAAVIYSLLATCKKHDVNPWLWLSDVLARIPTHPHKRIDELLPHLWDNSKV